MEMVPDRAVEHPETTPIAPVQVAPGPQAPRLGPGASSRALRWITPSHTVRSVRRRR